MHRARDSRGRFIARAKSSIFTTPATSRHRQDTPPLSPTHTPSLRIPGIQETGRPIVIEELESSEEEGEISSSFTINRRTRGL
jgi:hypothetical protein